MYKHLLVATDGSELAHNAMRQAIGLANAIDAKMTIVTVTEPWHAYVAGDGTVIFPIEEYDTSIAKWAEATLARAAQMASEAGVTCATVHVKGAHPGEGIVEAADNHNCDLIVMGSHGRRGLTRLLLGSQAHHVVTQTNRPVLICR